MMRILHGPLDYGGQGFKISRAQRKLGHKSDFAVFRPSFSYFPADFVLKDEKGVWSRSRKLSFLLRCLKDYDIFHLHSDSIFASEFKDIPLLKALGKKVIFHFHGTDIRGKKMHPRIGSSHALMVSTPDLFRYVPDAIWIPQPVDLEYWTPPAADKLKKIITILHAPTNRMKSGTDFIISTVEELKREGYPVDLSLIERQPYEKLKPYYQAGDIFMDKITLGIYGNIAIEGMALKKPVCAFINEEVVSFYPKELPVVNTSPDNLKQNLKRLIEDERLRKELGEKGRAYVEKYHHVKKVALKCLSIYRNC
jgi:glycosyltransferase involved in cell wall biosynthesis